MVFNVLLMLRCVNGLGQALDRFRVALGLV